MQIQFVVYFNLYLKHTCTHLSASDFTHVACLKVSLCTPLCTTLKKHVYYLQKAMFFSDKHYCVNLCMLPSLNESYLFIYLIFQQCVLYQPDRYSHLPSSFHMYAVVAVEGERSEGLRQQIYTVGFFTGSCRFISQRHHGQLVHRLLCTQLQITQYIIVTKLQRSVLLILTCFVFVE